MQNLPITFHQTLKMAGKWTQHFSDKVHVYFQMLSPQISMLRNSDVFLLTLLDVKL